MLVSVGGDRSWSSTTTTGSRAAGQIDRDLPGTRASSRSRCARLPARMRTRSPPQPRAYVARPALHRDLDAAVRARARCADRQQPSRAVRRRRRPTTARRRPSRQQENSEGRALLVPRIGYSTQPRARCRPGPDPRARRQRSGGSEWWSAPASRSRVVRSSPARHRAGVPARRRADARARAARLLSRGSACVGAAAPDGRRRSPGRCRRPRAEDGDRRPGAEARCGCWPRPSTTCSTGSPTRSTASGSSSPTRRTSCARR